jgi:hypothetical protein
VAVSHERNIGILLSLWRHDDQLLLIFVLSRCRSAGVVRSATFVLKNGCVPTCCSRNGFPGRTRAAKSTERLFEGAARDTQRAREHRPYAHRFGGHLQAISATGKSAQVDVQACSW